MLHAGPGARAAGLTADTWSGLSGALADIQADISTGVSVSGASWVGAAADSARDALGPLGDWAQQAAAAAELMQLSTTMQGDLLGKARTDMPVPVAAPDPAELNPIKQLMSAQLDAEQVEAAHDAAAQRAFQVMTDYESGTTDNTSTLGEFGTPPALVVDTSPITGIPLRRSAGAGSAPREDAASRVRAPGVAEEESTPRRTTAATRGTTANNAEPTAESTAPRDAPASTPTSAHADEPAVRAAAVDTESAATATENPAATGPTAAQPPSPTETAPAPRSGAIPTGARPAPLPRTTRGPESAGKPQHRQATRAQPRQPQPTTADRHPAGGTAGHAATTNPSAAHQNETTGPSTVAGGEHDAPGAPLVPSSRGTSLVEDEIIQSSYVVLGEDIYGEPQQYTQPVIGESGR
jgi:hypothetical protein